MMMSSVQNESDKGVHIVCISVMIHCLLIVCIAFEVYKAEIYFLTRVQYIGFEYELWTEFIKKSDIL